MKIAILAADSRTGKYLIDKLLERGHQINAGIYSVKDLPDRENLTYVRCDASNFEQVRQLIKGQDAVVSLIGHTKNSPPDIQTTAIKNLINALKAENINRVISLTGTGVRFNGDKIPAYDRFLNLAVSIVDPNRVQDGISHAEVLKESNLDWTIVRVLKLQNTKSSKFSLRAHGPTKLYVSREDVASAIVEVLENSSFVKEAPILGRV